MRTTLIAGTSNVLRFPVELRERPSFLLLADLAPDIREVLLIGEAYGLAPPDSDLCDRTDEETAEYILNHVPAMGPQRRPMLDALLRASLQAAIATARAANGAAVAAAEAREAVRRAKAGHDWLEPLQERAEARGRAAAEALLIAHARAEEARGVARAVSIASAGEVWTPRDPEAEFKALMALGRRRTG
jgi:hypothetical protein